MTTLARTDRISSWARGLALLLVLSVGVQGVPLQAVVQSVQHATAHHQCDHPEGVCPMNPDGPCTCDHGDTTSDSTDEPVFTSCNSHDSSVALTTTRLTWVAEPAPQLPRRHATTAAPRPRHSILVSQRVGDDIFRPPRTPAERRPVPTLQAPVLA
ncbi:MAG: hypothetical protein ACLFTE_06965 [Salinivenus sp.]